LTIIQYLNNAFVFVRKTIYNSIMEFSLIFKNLRLREKLTQKELAQELNIPQSTIAKYEKGQLEANYKNLIKIANFFNVTIDHLFGRDNQ